MDIVRARPDEMEQTIGEPLGIVETRTMEQSFGWVFFYNTRKFIETEESKYMLAGNAPFIVNRMNGNVHETGTAEPIEFYIDEFRSRQPRGN